MRSRLNADPHPLDRPVWSALSTRHRGLAQGGTLAKRYPSSIASFAVAADDRSESLAALASLIQPGEQVYLLQADAIVLPPDLKAVTTATAVQMVATASLKPIADHRIQPLDQADASDMLALAQLTKPGPFTLQALKLGRFWGVKAGGRLIAMAGERMRQPGYTELSGVCTHPDGRGQGLGKRLSLFVAGQICQGGDTPYLHAYATNVGAMTLYQSIGFTVRCAVNVAVVERVR